MGTAEKKRAADRGARSLASSLRPTVIAASVLFAIVVLLFLTVSSTISRIADGRAMISGLKGPWRTMLRDSSSDRPDAEREREILSAAAAFEEMADVPTLRYLSRVSPPFSSQLADIGAAVGAYAKAAALGEDPSPGASLGVDASFDALSAVVDGLADREIGTFRDLLLFILVLYFVLTLCIGIEALGAVRREERDEARRSFLSELMSRSDSEQQALARELHDDIAQDMAYAKSEAERLLAATAKESESSAAAADLRRLAEALAGTLGKTRAICSDLRQSVLKGGSLIESLRGLCSAMGERYGLEVRFELVGSKEPDWEEERKAQAVRIAQEALVNVARHALSREATLRLIASYPFRILLVEDRGRGRRGEPEGFGMRGIRERAELIGGSVSWEDMPGGGTRMTVRLLERERRRSDR